MRQSRASTELREGWDVMGKVSSRRRHTGNTLCMLFTRRGIC